MDFRKELREQVISGGIMQMQKTIKIYGETIKIVSRTCAGPGVRTNINGKMFFSNIEIMKDVKESNNFHKIFLQRAMDVAYVKWVKTQFMLY